MQEEVVVQGEPPDHLEHGLQLLQAGEYNRSHHNLKYINQPLTCSQNASQNIFNSIQFICNIWPPAQNTYNSI